MITADIRSLNPVIVTLAEPGEDAELKAIAYIRSVIDGFDHAVRNRILGYCMHRAAEDMKKETGQKPVSQ